VSNYIGRLLSYVQKVDEAWRDKHFSLFRSAVILEEKSLQHFSKTNLGTGVLKTFLDFDFQWEGANQASYEKVTFESCSQKPT